MIFAYCLLGAIADVLLIVWTGIAALLGSAIGHGLAHWESR